MYKTALTRGRHLYIIYTYETKGRLHTELGTGLHMMVLYEHKPLQIVVRIVNSINDITVLENAPTPSVFQSCLKKGLSALAFTV